jgi:hypothetical protein
LISNANIAELKRISSQLRSQGWKIVGWASTVGDPKQSATRAANAVSQYSLDGWIANGEEWWEKQHSELGPVWLKEFQKQCSKPLALSCLSSTTGNYARSFQYIPWIQNKLSIQPQVYGNDIPELTVDACIGTMTRAGIPPGLLNLTFGTYHKGKPIPWNDYAKWKGPRSIYIGERISPSEYQMLAR